MRARRRSAGVRAHRRQVALQELKAYLFRPFVCVCVCVCVGVLCVCSCCGWQLLLHVSSVLAACQCLFLPVIALILLATRHLTACMWGALMVWP